MAYRELGTASLVVVQAVDAALNNEDKHLLIACSGGADSLALAFAARYVAIRRYLEYAAVVIDHGLQDGSADVAASVEQQLDRLGYDDVIVTTVEVDQSAVVGPEAAAREARYRALDAEARARSATVLIGHTLDDQAETVCWAWPVDRAAGRWPGCHLGPATCCGHSFTSAVKRPSRPVQSKDSTRGRTPQHRSSVYPGAGTRDRAAHAGDRTRSRRCRSLGTDCGAAARRHRLLDRLAAEAYRTAEGLGGTDTLDCAALESQPPALRRRILRLWLLAHGIGDLTLRHISAVESLVIGWHGQKSIQVPGATVTRNAGRLRVG